MWWGIHKERKQQKPRKTAFPLTLPNDLMEKTTKDLLITRKKERRRRRRKRRRRRRRMRRKRRRRRRRRRRKRRRRERRRRREQERERERRGNGRGIVRYGGIWWTCQARANGTAATLLLGEGHRGYWGFWYDDPMGGDEWREDERGRDEEECRTRSGGVGEAELLPLIYIYIYIIYITISY